MMILAKLLQWTAAVLLGVAVTWWVVEHAGDNTATAVVHLTEPGVDVVVGDQTFRAEECPRSPLVCELPAGRHELRVSRGIGSSAGRSSPWKGASKWCSPPTSRRRAVPHLERGGQPRVEGPRGSAIGWSDSWGGVQAARASAARLSFPAPPCVWSISTGARGGES
jgi:hypothetical protein